MERVVVVQLTCCLHRAAAPVQLAQVVHVRVPDEQSSSAGWVAEELVEGDADEIGFVDGKVQTICGNEGCSIEKNEPFVTLLFRGWRDITSWK